MPLYQMPDGNSYEFPDDGEATIAMEAWNKQFGEQQAPKTSIGDQLLDFASKGYDALGELKDTVTPYIREGIANTPQAFKPMMGAAETIFDLTAGIPAMATGLGMKAKTYWDALQNGAPPEVAEEFANRFAEQNNPIYTPKPVMPEAKALEEGISNVFNTVVKGAGKTVEMGETAKDTLLGRFGYNVDPQVARYGTELGAEGAMVMAPALGGFRKGKGKAKILDETDLGALERSKPKPPELPDIDPALKEAGILPEEVYRNVPKPEEAPLTYPALETTEASLLEGGRKFKERKAPTYEGEGIPEPTTPREIPQRPYGPYDIEGPALKDILETREEQARRRDLYEQQRGEDVLPPELRGQQELYTFDAVKAWKDIQDIVKKYGVDGDKILPMFKGFLTPKEIESVLSRMGSKSRATVVLMDPADFLKVAKDRNAQMRDLTEAQKKVLAEEKRGPIRKYIDEGEGLNSMPWLGIRKGGERVAEVWGHEGRHRADVAIERGIKKIPVLVEDSMLRWGESEHRPSVLIGEDGVSISMPESIFYPSKKYIDKIEAQRQQMGLTTPGKGFSGLGKKQGGAWTPFESTKKKSNVNGWKSFEDFQQAAKEKGYDDATIANAWKELGGEAKDPQVTQFRTDTKKADKVKTLLGKDTHIPVIDWKDHQTALDIINKSEDLKSDLNFYEKHFAARGHMLGEFTRNPGIRAGLDIIKGTLDHFAERSQQWLNKQGGIIYELTKMEKLLAPGDAADVLLQRIQAKGDPNFKFNWKTKEQEALNAKLDQIFKTMIDEANEVRTAQGKEPIQGLPNYFGALFKGNHYFTIYDANGKPVEIFTSHNKWKAKYYRRLLEADGFKVSRLETSEALTGKTSANHAIAEYELMQDLLSDTSAEAIRARTTLNSLLQADATTTARYHDRFKPWIGRLGFEGGRTTRQRIIENPTWNRNANYYDAKMALYELIEAHNSWMAAQQLAKFNKELTTGKPSNVKTVLEREIVDAVAHNAEMELVKILQDVIQGITGFDHPSQKSLASQYASIVTAQFTGFGSIRAVVQNVLQPLMVAIPKMSELLTREGHSLDVATPLMFGLKDFSDVLIRHQANEFASLFNDFFRTDFKIQDKVFGVDSNILYKYAVDNGFIEPTVIEPRPMFKRKGPQSVWKNTAGALVRTSEQAARFATFSTLARYMRKADEANGIPLEQTMAKAAKLTETYMTDYSDPAKARIFNQTGVLGQMSGRLQTFTTNNYTQLYKYLKLAKETGNPIPAMTMLGLTLAVTGITGLHGFNIASMIYDKFFKNEDDPTDSLAGKIIKDAHPVLSMGALSYYTNHGLQGAFAISTGFNDMMKSLLPVYSDLPEKAKAIGMLSKNNWNELSEPEKARILKSGTPSTFTGIIEDQYLTEGKSVRSPFTGESVYEKPDNRMTLSNIKTFDQAFSAMARNQYKKEIKAMNEAKKETLAEMYQLAIDMYTFNNNNPFKQNRFNKLVDKYVKQGGAQIDIENILTEAGIPDPLTRELMKGQEVTPSNVQRKMNAMKYKEAIDRSRELMNAR